MYIDELVYARKHQYSWQDWVTSLFRQMKKYGQHSWLNNLNIHF